MTDAWRRIRGEAATFFRSPEGFPLHAYSEFMPPPWVALKPHAPQRLLPPAHGADGVAVTEFEEARELRPGLEKIARHVLGELANLASGRSHGLSHALLRDNPAWPADLAAGVSTATRPPLFLLLPLALSRTQDDKGRVRWTLFGGSHTGPASAFWRGFAAEGGTRDFCRLASWLLARPAVETMAELARLGLRVLRRMPDPERPELDEGELPAWLRPLLLDENEPLSSVRTLLTFEAFGRLPAVSRQAFLHGALRLVPWPGSLVFWDHRGYRRLAAGLPHAMQVPLLHLFPRSETSYGVRIPQSGWLDEQAGGELARSHGHRLVHHVVRSHRFQRVARDTETPAEPFADRVTTALFSTAPDDLGLYGKPMARNVQIWTEDYEPLLDGPAAGPEALADAVRRVDAGGRFGYRFVFPPMQAGSRALFWHRPLVARLDPASGDVALPDAAPLGVVTAERRGAASLELMPILLDRPGYREAATAFDADPGHARLTTAANVRRLLEWSELLGQPLEPTLARALLDAGRETDLEGWLAGLAARAADAAAGARAAAALRHVVAPDGERRPGREAGPPPGTFTHTASRTFEERLWRDMAALAEGEWRDKDNADPVVANTGRAGGTLGRSLGREPAPRRDLDAVADWLHAQHRERIRHCGMEGRAFVADQRFRWETDFAMPWSKGWAANHGHDAAERNVVVVIPGRDQRSVVVMADHYDTAYMEDLYDPARGGDRLRAAAAGADDNHSATAALLGAAQALLPLSREGRLARTVWLVHLTGEEFPADCLGARALVRAAVRGELRLEAQHGRTIELPDVRLAGAFVLDMIGHNHDRDRDVFQIAPGEGEGSARLARLAHEAAQRWNETAREANRADGRCGRGRAVRMPDGREPPPVAEHLLLRGEIRPEWDPRSALYNTDGQIFSDAGIPVVLFMENYDISRAGYHDTHDTMANIDLDYAAALAAVAIESVAAAASEP
ncbi:MAG: M28 family peptidase [Deltaproteobacteria bacterium]|nr:M28 family peptidase [Deltaproteobacteria bacterium]